MIEPTMPRVLSDREVAKLIAACVDTRYPVRNKVIVLLSVEAGLTPMEMSWLKRYSVCTADGLLGGHIDLEGKKGRNLVARKVPMAPDGRLRQALAVLLAEVPAVPKDPVIISERAREGGGATKTPGETVLEPMRPTSITYVLWKLAGIAGIDMDGTRDGRRTFIASAARAVREIHGSARDVQAMVGHRSLDTTQRFMEADWEIQNRAIGNLFNQRPASG